MASHRHIDTSRRNMLRGAAAALGGMAMAPLSARAALPTPAAVPDAIRLDFVMDIVAACSAGERMGPDAHSKDGLRELIWPITGGRFAGPGLRGEVVPGGADFPVTRPDGVTVLDALYRLRTDDGVTIIIHNHGMAYEPEGNLPLRYRGFTEFTAPEGRYGWLNKSMFTGILIDSAQIPPALAMPVRPGENLRLVRIFRMN